MRPTVFLWDIDGTLVSTSGSGRRAVERSLARRFGRVDALSFRLDGMTDRLIMKLALETLGVPAADLEREIDAQIAAYLEELVHETAAASYRVHAGVERALDATVGRPGYAVGLGTGNVAAGARIKLEKVGLFGRFAFGGFGDDHIDRATLIRVGAERGAALLGEPLARCRVVVIGDTPKDVQAAHAMGATCVGVGTGRFTPDELLTAGADHAFTDLGASGAFAALLGD